MLSIVSQISTGYNYSSKNINVNFKEKNENQLQKDVFFDSEANAIKRDRLISRLSIIGFLTMLGLYLLKTNRNSFNTSAINKYKFESLKNDPNIPTLDSCSSLNKDLKIILQKQLNLLKAGRELLDEVGGLDQTNRFILSGPPASGKTFFSKIYSKSIDAEYLEVLFSDINSRWAGESVEKLDSLFKNIIASAKKNPEKKYVVTFNEIDTLLPPLEQLAESVGTHFATLRRQRATFLTYLDRLKAETPNVIVIGTTNLKPKTKNLDAATMSRFSKIIEVTYPDTDCLYEAIKTHLSKFKNIEKFLMDNDDKIRELAKTMSNRKFSYRDLNSVLDDAKTFYIEDKILDKNAKFKFEYLERAQQLLKNSDGEREVLI